MGRRGVRIGPALVRFGGHVGRCSTTTLDPESGRPDLPTLDLLRFYRGELDTTEPLPFGVYGEVLERAPSRSATPSSWRSRSARGRDRRPGFAARIVGEPQASVAARLRAMTAQTSRRVSSIAPSSTAMARRGSSMS